MIYINTYLYIIFYIYIYKYIKGSLRSLGYTVSQKTPGIDC